MSEIRIVARNNAETGGVFTTPLWFGLHNGEFDLFNVGESVSTGLERIAEDGSFDDINAEFSAAQPEGASGAVFGPGTPPVFGPGQIGATTIEIDESAQTYLSFAAMLLPSNDAFFGTDDAVSLFGPGGNFRGEQNIEFFGEDVYDAGTELNTELDAAFINQTAPNTGETENGVVTQHEGFIGSLEGPEGDGTILGGVNAVGAEIDPVAADFTQPNYELFTVHVNDVARFTGSFRDELYIGSGADDIVHGRAGDDILRGRGGWDELRGGAGDDRLSGNRGADELYGGAGDDRLRGGRDTDVLEGGAGDDRLIGGADDDLFVFALGSGADEIRDFTSGEDVISLTGYDVASVDDLLASATQSAQGLVLNLSETDSILLTNVSAADLGEEDFIFG